MGIKIIKRQHNRKRSVVGLALVLGTGEVAEKCVAKASRLGRRKMCRQARQSRRRKVRRQARPSCHQKVRRKRKQLAAERCAAKRARFAKAARQSNRKERPQG